MSFNSGWAELREWLHKKNRETSIQRQVVSQKIADDRFYSEYTDFTKALLAKLELDLGEDSQLGAVSYTYNTPRDAKYLERVLHDVRFIHNYNISKSVGGDYTFSRKSVMDAINQQKGSKR